MNLYDVLRVLVNKAGLAEKLADDCRAAIQESEQMHVLGTTAQRIDARGHVHSYGRNGICIYCPATEDDDL